MGMILAGTASRADIADYLADTYDLDARQHGALALLTMRYRLVGPLPFDDRRLAQICRVTKGVWVKHIWPAIQSFFTPGDDGLIHHEELDRLPRTGDSKRSEAARAAATSRWEARKARQLSMLSPDAEPMRSHANAYADASGNSTISKTFASETHANRIADASPDASEPARAGTHTLSDSSSESPESQPSSVCWEGSGEGAANASADASGHAEPMRSHAIAYADASSAHAAGGRSKHALPTGWQPSARARAEVEKMGVDPDAVLRELRLWADANGTKMQNWDSQYIRFGTTASGRRQPGLMMAVSGGKAAAVPPDDGSIDNRVAAAEHDLPAELREAWGRVRAELRGAVGALEYRNWLRAMVLVAVTDDGEVRVALPTPFLRDWVRSRYADQIEKLWRTERPSVRRLDVSVVTPRERAA
jgi:uncharacterized protein YdaU (DUF1376 family)